MRRVAIGGEDALGQFAPGAGAGDGTAVGFEARRKPQNITTMPARSDTENSGSLPSAANVEPKPAMIVAPIAMSSVPTNRSFSSGRPRIRHADQSVPPTSTR